MKTALRSSRRSTVSQRLKRNYPLNTGIPFAYSGAPVNVVVPPGAFGMVVDIRGGQGGDGGSAGANGGRLQATIPVTPGETLQLRVGGRGTTGAGVGTRGYNGGGSAGDYPGHGGGGGATDIRRGAFALADRIAVAGGGGGSISNIGSGFPNIGHGGGTSGAKGINASGGFGGTQLIGGAGGAQGGAPGTVGGVGTFGQGGDGGVNTANVGGGGGGGYYGGGGGGAGGTNGGGGGGSNYAISTATDVTHTQGSQTGHGAATLTFVPAEISNKVWVSDDPDGYVYATIYSSWWNDNQAAGYPLLVRDGANGNRVQAEVIEYDSTKFRFRWLKATAPNWSETNLPVGLTAGLLNGGFYHSHLAPAGGFVGKSGYGDALPFPNVNPVYKGNVDFVQIATSGNTSGSTTVTATLGTPAIAGNLLVALFAFDQSKANAGSPPPSGWTQIGDFSAFQADDYTAVWAKTAAGGETAITHTTGSVSDKTLTVMELSGARITDFQHVAEGNTMSASTDYPIGPLSAEPGDMGIMFFARTAGVSGVAATPMGWLAHGSFGRMHVFTKEIADTTLSAIQRLSSGSGNFNGHMVVIKANPAPHIVQGKTATVFAASTNVVVNHPVGRLLNDTLIVALEWDAAESVTTPSGWSMDASITGPQTKLAVFTRPVDGSEGTSTTFVASASGTKSAAIMLGRGLQNPAKDQALSASNTSSADATFAAITPVNSNALSLLVEAHRNSNESVTSPAGYTEVVDYAGDPNNHLSVSWKGQNVLAEFPAVSAVHTAATSWVSLHLVLKGSSDDPTFVGASSDAHGNTQVDPGVIAVPAGVRPGDTMLVAMTEAAGRAITPPAGWTLMESAVTPGALANLSLFHKIAGVSEPASYSFDFDNASYTGIVMLVYRNAQLVATSALSENTKSSSKAIVPSLPKVADGAVALSFSSVNAGSAASCTNPSGMTSRASSGSRYLPVQASEKVLDSSGVGAKLSSISPTQDGFVFWGISALLERVSPRAVTGPKYMTSKVVGTGGSTTHNVPVPTHASGDLLVIVYKSGNAPNATPSGLTSLGTQGATRVYYRIADGSEPASYTFTHPTNNNIVGACLVYKQAGTPVWVGGASGTNPPSASCVAGDLVVGAVGNFFQSDIFDSDPGWPARVNWAPSNGQAIIVVEQLAIAAVTLSPTVTGATKTDALTFKIPTA